MTLNGLKSPILTFAIVNCFINMIFNVKLYSDLAEFGSLFLQCVTT